MQMYYDWAKVLHFRVKPKQNLRALQLLNFYQMAIHHSVCFAMWSFLLIQIRFFLFHSQTVFRSKNRHVKSDVAQYVCQP